MLSIWIGCLALKFVEPLKMVEIPSIKAVCGWSIEAVLLTFGRIIIRGLIHGPLTRDAS